MTRKELIEGMFNAFFVADGDSLNKVAGMSGVLDFLTKETVEGRVGYQTLDEDARPWVGTPIAGEEVDVIAFGTGGATKDRYPLTGEPSSTAIASFKPGTEVQAIILDLPDEPSAARRAAAALRSQAKWLDGAIVCNARIDGRNTDDLRTLAAELEKEASK